MTKAKLHHCEICDLRGREAKRVSFSLSERDHLYIKEAAAILNMSKASFIRHVIHDMLEEEDTLTPLSPNYLLFEALTSTE